ncbi:hypothetical protein SAMN06265379_10883 [Saccharicrinis carchari]|uniref:DUF5723 domain-containing protein n=2 Tax=Saccharicrinis carchari TaxID=1168039 RepID=A0A521EC62_SACCC|nr:hypothetical protein SAMN06265379_10883 [Saccharicrinis carchari]
MVRSLFFGLLFLLLCTPSAVLGQYGDMGKKLVIDGYLVNMQSVSISERPIELPDSLGFLTKGDKHIYNTNISFQNRLNLFWYVNDKLSVTAQMRNRLIVGDQVRMDFTGQLEDSYENTDNFFNPAWNVAVGNSYILNLAFDRIYAEYTSGNLAISLGKQRINWGKTFAFNPNDMFNTYAYFDFDYEEKPGTDAFRAMYYTGAASSVEVAANIDSARQVSAAIKWNANLMNYDFQVLGGMLKSKDLALGFGWSGYIKDASWRGELAWYQPFENFRDTSGLVMLSTGMDYSFSSKWTVQTEMMLAKLPKGKEIVFFDAYAPPQSVKDLATSPFQLLASAMFQASPLSSFSLTGIWYPHPDIKGVFIGPSWAYSLADNLSASLYWQFFHGNFPDILTNKISRQSINSGFLRLKYSF